MQSWIDEFNRLLAERHPDVNIWALHSPATVQRKRESGYTPEQAIVQLFALAGLSLVRWWDGSQSRTAPSLNPKFFGPHNYDYGVISTQTPQGLLVKARGTCRCGCWKESGIGGGPVSPNGPCPANRLVSLKEKARTV